MKCKTCKYFIKETMKCYNSKQPIDKRRKSCYAYDEYKPEKQAFKFLERR